MMECATPVNSGTNMTSVSSEMTIENRAMTTRNFNR